MAKSKASIYSALAANLLISITKFAAGAATSSGSMTAEGTHSVVDTANEVLLLYGLRRSQKPPDKLRPFGYGKELYFWSFIVSILIFGLGGGVSIYQGIMHIRAPEPLGDPKWNYIVLGFSVVFEGISFVVALRAFNRIRGSVPFYKAVVQSKDPATFLVLFEDGAAVMGLVVVFGFMQASHHLNKPFLDGVASVLVGLLLVAVSMLLARESRSLLMGEGIGTDTQQKIKMLAEKDPAVIKVLSILSTYQSPEEVVLMLIVQFEPELNTEGITDAIERLRLQIKNRFPLVEFVVIQPQAANLK